LCLCRPRIPDPHGAYRVRVRPRLLSTRAAALGRGGHHAPAADGLLFSEAAAGHFDRPHGGFLTGSMTVRCANAAGFRRLRLFRLVSIRPPRRIPAVLWLLAQFTAPPLFFATGLDRSCSKAFRAQLRSLSAGTVFLLTQTGARGDRARRGNFRWACARFSHLGLLLMTKSLWDCVGRISSQWHLGRTTARSRCC